MLSQQTINRLAQPLFTTVACVAEAMHLAGSRIGWRAQDEIWQIVTATDLVLASSEIATVERLMRKYRDVPMDYADTTLVAVSSVHSQARIAAFDSDFLAYRRDDGTPVPLADDRLLGWE